MNKLICLVLCALVAIVSAKSSYDPFNLKPKLKETCGNACPIACEFMGNSCVFIEGMDCAKVKSTCTDTCTSVCDCVADCSPICNYYAKCFEAPTTEGLKAVNAMAMDMYNKLPEEIKNFNSFLIKTLLPIEEEDQKPPKA